MAGTMRALYALLYVLAPLPPMLAVYHTDPSMYTNTSSRMAMASSTIAFTWLVLQLVLASRPRFAEKHYGMDKLYKLHSYMGVAAVALVAVHRAVQEPIWRGSSNARLGDSVWFTLIAVAISGMVFLADSPVSRLKPVARLKRALSANWTGKYSTHALFHQAASIAYVVLLLHVLGSGAVQTSPTAKIILVGYWTIGAAFMVYYKLIKRMALERRAFTVSDIRLECPATWTLRLVPRDRRRTPALIYKPGQFGFLRMSGSGISSEPHPFSLTSTPTDTASITVTIKELGDWTGSIGRVKPGMRALFDGPYGTFSYLDHPEDRVVVLIAGGVGITPALSMLRHMAAIDRDRHVALFWGANTAAELAWLEELRGMQAVMPNFKLIPVVWRDDAWDGEKGFVDREKLERHLAPYLAGAEGGPEAMGYYVCGPGPMLKAVLASLAALGVRGNRIRNERFSL